MKDFEVKYRRAPNSPVMTWKIKAADENGARKAAMRFLANARGAKVLSVRELTGASK
jgi:hypothetical protein